VRILAISGSLRAGSHNTQLLRAAGELAPPGVSVELFDGLAEIPPFSVELEADPPEPVLRLKQGIEAADAVLFATPEYNSSVPGQLKNALDWASRPPRESPLRNKDVAVTGASTNAYGAMWAQADLRRILGRIGARVLGAEVPVPLAHEKFDPGGRLTDPETREALAALLRELAGSGVPARAAA
jgi:chromate reductase